VGHRGHHSEDVAVRRFQQEARDKRRSDMANHRHGDREPATQDHFTEADHDHELRARCPEG
jgi:hypothetical protein